jgi:hypothetical protein
MEKEQKTSRASQTKAKTAKKVVWTPPSSLDAPNAPAGYRHRWIRAEVMGFDDSKNMAAMIRSGYELVRADEYPEEDYPVMKEGKYAGMIGVGGLVLARIPEEIAKARQDYYDKQNEAKEEAIKHDILKEQHPSMPISQERQTRVTFGGTKKN